MSKEEDVEIISPRKQKPEDTEMDITPMIDITFLLLSFFVVCSKMDPTTAVDLPKAIYGDAISEKDAIVFIVAAGDSKGKFDVYRGRSKEDDTRIRETEPLAIEEAVTTWVEEQLREKPDAEAILIKGEAKVVTQGIETVKRGISQSERASTRRIYVGVEENQ